MIEASNKHLTYTNAKGEFPFLGNLSEKATIKAPGVVQDIPQIQATRKIVLHPSDFSQIFRSCMTTESYIEPLGTEPVMNLDFFLPAREDYMHLVKYQDDDR